MPSTITPAVDDGAVWSVAQVGNTMVMGGSFTSIGGVSHPYIAAINATTGAMSSGFQASTDGQVYSVLPGPNDHTVYVGGSFTHVNGQAAQFLTMLDTNTGQIVSTFQPPAFNFGMIRDMAVSGNRLYLGGFFTKVGNKDHGGLATLNATTGALDPYMNVQLAGHHNDSGSGAQGFPGPWAIDISPDGQRLVATGNFKTADGLLRDQLVMIDLNSDAAVVDTNWATTRYAPYCFNWAFDGYTRGVTFAPDSSYFVVNATGGGVPGTLCDATSRFETASTGTNIQPTWVDETGGDTVWGVTVTDDAVYIGGHNRWNNNPQGVDRAKPGAVPRPGLAALDPVSGRPYTWNPGHNPLGAAVYCLLATPSGLWLGYDFDWIGNVKYKRMKIAFFPYQGGSTLASTATGQLPGTAYLGRSTSNGATNILYRVDAGGPEIAATDGGPNWSEDDAAQQSPYVNVGGSSVADYGPIANRNPIVPASTPSAIFDHERWSSSDNPGMNWDFPVPSGTHVTVRMYFANRYTGTSRVGQRVFNVNLEGTRVLNNYDIVKDTGDQTGTMKSFNVTSDGHINISLTHVTENPLIDGIEIINNDVPAGPPPSDSLSAVGFDGTTATGPTPVLGSGIPWSQTRGAFMVGNQLYYGSSDGFLYRTTVTGSTFGTATKVDPYHDPVWDGVDTHDGTTFDGASPTLYSQMPNVTGMFYSGGKLYFTMANDATLRSAWFSPDSGIVDNTETAVPSSTSFAQADGMFLSGNTLYFVKKSDKSLYSVTFSNGAVTGTPQLVNGPGNGGVDWTNNSLFFQASPPANKPPTAAFASTCTNGGCAFNGGTSSDPDGSIVDYAWNFGDGSNGDGVATSHAYSATGDYTVQLTVTDNSGATDVITHQVSISSLSKQIGFVGAAHSAPGSKTSKSVTVPASASVGDTMVLVFTQTSSVTWSSPGAGWTAIGTPLTNSTIMSSAWVKTVGAGDPGSTVTLVTPTASKAVMSLGVYSGVSTSAPVDVSAVVGDPGGISHTTPTVNPTAGDWVASFWTDKSAAVNLWTAPAGVTERDAAYDTGTSGRYSALLADSGGPVAGGPYGGFTATTDADSAKAIMWTIALRPDSATPNQNPIAAFTSSCDTGGSCSFDGGGSSDPDGTIASYAWTFGDGGTASTPQPTHSYSASGSYDVQLTVTDNKGGTNSVTHQVPVTVSTPPSGISFVGASHSAPGSQTSKSVTVPASANVGDTAVMVLTYTKGVAWSSPGAGWTQIGTTFTNVSISSSAWVKRLGAGDPGSTVTVTAPSASKATLSLATYDGVAAAAVDSFAVAGDAGGTSHTTPTVNAGAGDWVASWWTDKSTAVSAWTAPAAVTKRNEGYDTGTSGRFSELIGDSAGPVSAGAYGGLTATTDTSSDKAIMWTIALTSS